MKLKVVGFRGNIIMEMEIIQVNGVSFDCSNFSACLFSVNHDMFSQGDMGSGGLSGSLGPRGVQGVRGQRGSKGQKGYEGLMVNESCVCGPGQPRFYDHGSSGDLITTGHVSL